MSFDIFTLDFLWRNAIGAVPFAIAVALICRWLPCRPSTRHALWLILLVSLLAPPILKRADLAAWWSQSAATITGTWNAVQTERAVTEAPIRPVIAPPSQIATAFSSKPNPTPTPTPMATPTERPQAAKVAPPQRTVARDEPLVGPPAPKTTLIATAADPVTVVMPWFALTRSDAIVSEPQAVVKAELPTMRASSFAPRGVARNRSVQANDLAAQPREIKPAAQPMIAGTGPAPMSPPESIASTPAPVDHAPSTPSQFSTQWRRWSAQLVAIADDIAGLSPIPTTLWLGGSVLVLVTAAWRIVRFRRLLRNAVPASRLIHASVTRAAQQIGLKRVPRTLMVRDRMSPLVLCGPRPLLLLPEDLWTELDDLGRQAVLLHELAHLRRRDHWVCWLEMIIGALYWWHPLVWWIRRRLRDEADLCCDAWVTTLLPGGRSAYARALLATRQYISSESSFAPPAVGLGVTTNKAKRFARRLTMVMTERTTPRTSLMGTGFATVLAAAAWLATPLFACPPTESTPSAQAGTAARVRVIAPTAPRAASPAPETADTTTYERYMGERGAAAASATPAPHTTTSFGAVTEWRGGSNDDRLSHLEQRLDQLTAQLEHLMAMPHAASSDPFAGRAAVAPAAPRQPLVKGFAAVPPVPPVGQPPAPPAMRAGPMGGVASTGGVSGNLFRSQGFNAKDDGGVIKRVYHLPAGKLQALTELMKRSDVPVLISVQSDGIEVQGTAQQHEVFAAFVELINPSGNHAAPAGAGSAANKRVQEAMELARVYGESAKAYAKDQGLADRIRQAVQATHEQRRAIENEVRAQRQRSKQLYRQAEELQKRAEQLQSKAEELSDEAARSEVNAQAEAMQAEAESVEAMAEAAEEQADSIQDQADAAQDQLDSLREQMEEAAEAAAEADEIAMTEATDDAPDSVDFDDADEAPEAPPEPVPAPANPPAR